MSASTRQPDILEVIADLSNDEVRTSPRIVNQVLDMLPEEVWTDETLRWLDPGCKTGSFLREVTKRLLVGLEEKIPDEQERLEHILKNMVFGIAITELTALMSRRTLYCSKDASGAKSIVRMDSPEGHILFDDYEHAFQAGKCKDCGASEEAFGDESSTGRHAYAFIHDGGRSDLEKVIDMNFDVIIGNPPYQMATQSDSRGATPLYNLFVQQAKALNPRYMALIIPSRWMVGGLGLDEFRAEMLSDQRIKTMKIFPDADEVFPGPDIKGGICYFLWDRDDNGECEVTVSRAGEIVSEGNRNLAEFDVFVRDSRALGILKKVLSADDFESFREIVSSRKPFGLTNKYKGHGTKPPKGTAVQLWASGDRSRWTTREEITDNEDLIDRWKVMLPKAGPGNSGGHIIPDNVIGKGEVASPASACTDTFLAVGPFTSRSEAESAVAFLQTRMARFLVSLRKITQNAARNVYLWVPQQTWDREWTDEELYKKYGITEEEQAYIAEMIKEMPS